MGLVPTTLRESFPSPSGNFSVDCLWIGVDPLQSEKSEGLWLEELRANEHIFALFLSHNTPTIPYERDRSFVSNVHSNKTRWRQSRRKEHRREHRFYRLMSVSSDEGVLPFI